MPLSIDPAIVEALSIQNASATIERHGGSGFASTFKIKANINGEDMLYFVKTGGIDSNVMFAGEHESLNAINSTVPSFCPKSFANGALASTPGFFLATEFLDLRSSSLGPSSGHSFARKLAALHTTPAPTPPGFSSPQFGFQLPTCCGSTEQSNDYSTSWAEFYANQRLRAILKSAEKNNGNDSELRNAVEQVCSVVVQRLLGDGHLNRGSGVMPVTVHGDLWSGNHGRGSIGNRGVEEVVYDPSSCYGHSEYDLGIMRMFGGFGTAFYAEYHELKPKDEPIEEYNDRVLLYELYHHLNHYAMFGGGYRSGGLSIMKKLIRKYGMS